MRRDKTTVRRAQGDGSLETPADSDCASGCGGGSLSLARAGDPGHGLAARQGGRASGLPCRTAGKVDRAVLPWLRSGGRVVAAACGLDDFGGGGTVRVPDRAGPGVLCSHDRGNAGVSGGALLSAGLGTGTLRGAAKSHRSGDRARWCLLSLYPSADPGCSVLCRQSGNGPYEDRLDPVLSGQPGRDAGRHSSLCKRRNATGRAAGSAGDPFPAAPAVVRPHGLVSMVGQGRRRRRSPPTDLFQLAKATRVRQKPRGDRRGGCRTGLGLYRSRRSCEGDAGRSRKDGRRLPELRLCAVKGTDPVGETGPSDAQRGPIWAASGRTTGIVSRRFHAHPQCHRRDCTA